ncbi:MAG: class I SAM-dependent methyltransferase [Alphaproteobacteria bacterium]|nr:class I SAM-dependent methyltransferase [Alphaproteobacteria bacterium]
MDYSKNAEFYKYRPNYSPKAISMLMDYVGAKTNNQEYSVADIGAGTGNLTILLLDKGLSNVTAVEPNYEMRKIGEQVTEDKAKWGTASRTEHNDRGNFCYKLVITPKPGLFPIKNE